MKLIIRNKEYEANEIGKFGREGELFTVAGYSMEKVVKVYDHHKRTAYCQRKIAAIINQFGGLHLGGVENFLAFPELPVFDADNGGFCGFVMKYFDAHLDIYDYRFNLETFSYMRDDVNESEAVSIIASLFAYLEVIHNAGFILGDVNPDNILLNKKSLMPVIVDFDSAQFGSFYSNTKRENYIDPSVQIDGYGPNKYFIYTMDSDIFSMAQIAYELVVGVNPYFFQTAHKSNSSIGPTDRMFHKNEDLSFLDYFEDNQSKTGGYGFDVFTNPLFEAEKARMEVLRDEQPVLYDFFYNVFIEGNRPYFSPSGREKYNVSSMVSVSNAGQDGWLDLLPQSKEDPPELELFMKQFGLSVC